MERWVERKTMNKKTFRLNCLSATVISALVMAISCFCANLGYGEYKSLRKRQRAAKTEQAKKISTSEEKSVNPTV